MEDLSKAVAEARENRIAQAASICYLVREYCANESNEFFNQFIVVDAMEAVHELLTYGDNL